MNNQTKKLPEHKLIKTIQSLHEPALHTLERLLEQRKANLRKRNDDEQKATVNRQEFVKAIHEDHRISFWYANEVVMSLKRSGKIKCFGSFINLPEINEGES
ncbi:hypothetical protein [Acinetobacter bereziniae]|uniref:hypothetical protein n=1 Tax=Acinetobacter bereziniae TaxID=106648 RepID=UPI00190150FD|nr:hypothetical protein [Acinetobacter bereziniae]MBJ8476609.1 hypothetical protein [Acinetobacter bereziniae]